MVDHLAIEFTAVGDDYLTASMPVDHRTKQPLGIMNGGASCALAESVGSTAANFCVDQTQHYCVGLSINTHHIHSAKSGRVYGTAKPLHLGRSTQVWQIEIKDDKQRLISMTELTLLVMSRKAREE